MYVNEQSLQEKVRQHNSNATERQSNTTQLAQNSHRLLRVGFEPTIISFPGDALALSHQGSSVGSDEFYIQIRQSNSTWQTVIKPAWHQLPPNQVLCKELSLQEITFCTLIHTSYVYVHVHVYIRVCTCMCIFIYACIHVHCILVPGYTEHGSSLWLLQEASSGAVITTDSCRPILLRFSIHWPPYNMWAHIHIYIYIYIQQMYMQVAIA